VRARTISKKGRKFVLIQFEHKMISGKSLRT